MSNLLARFLELPTERPAQEGKDHARAKILDTSSSKTGPSGPTGPSTEIDRPPNQVPEPPPAPIIPVIPPTAVAITSERNFPRRTEWQWVPEHPVIVDALQYSVREIMPHDRELALQMSNDWHRPPGSSPSIGEIESLLSKIAACRFLELDPASQPFALRINTWCRDLIFHRAAIYVVTNPWKDKIVSIRTYAAQSWKFALVVSMQKERSRAAGYLSSAEVTVIEKRDRRGSRPRTIMISCEVLKPYEWLPTEMAAQNQRRQSGDLLLV
jgi:hypothetical protein